MEELMPSIGSSVPTPSVLAVVISQSDSALQNIGKHFSNGHPTSSCDAEFDMDFDNPFDFRDDTHAICRTHFLSISDDGKIWNWLLTSEDPTNNPKDTSTEVGKHPSTSTLKISTNVQTLRLFTIYKFKNHY